MKKIKIDISGLKMTGLKCEICGSMNAYVRGAYKNRKICGVCWMKIILKAAARKTLFLVVLLSLTYGIVKVTEPREKAHRLSWTIKPTAPTNTKMLVRPYSY